MGGGASVSARLASWSLAQENIVYNDGRCACFFLLLCDTCSACCVFRFFCWGVVQKKWCARVAATEESNVLYA